MRKRSAIRMRHTCGVEAYCVNHIAYSRGMRVRKGHKAPERVKKLAYLQSHIEVVQIELLLMGQLGIRRYYSFNDLTTA